MKTKEKELVKAAFDGGTFKTFDNANEAKEIHELLDKYGITHDFGEYPVDNAFKPGIIVYDDGKLRAELAEDKPNDLK